MKCFICKKKIHDKDFDKVVHLYHSKDSVYCCTVHTGVINEKSIQENKQSIN